MNLKKKSEYLDLNPEKMIRVYDCMVLLLSGLSIKPQTGFSLQDCRTLAITKTKRLEIAHAVLMARLTHKPEPVTYIHPGGGAGRV